MVREIPRLSDQLPEAKARPVCGEGDSFHTPIPTPIQFLLFAPLLPGGWWEHQPGHQCCPGLPDDARAASPCSFSSRKCLVVTECSDCENVKAENHLHHL